MKAFLDIPPVWLTGFCILAWFLATELPLVTVAGPGLRLIGLLMIVLGFAAILWAGLYFLTRKTTIEPRHTPSALITDGPFRFSRNPIYLGMVLILTGYVFWMAALSAILLPGVFVSVLTLRFIQPEEERLRETFGAEATRYMARTRRWL